jgi:hypothetical protein
MHRKGLSASRIGCAHFVISAVHAVTSQPHLSLLVVYPVLAQVRADQLVQPRDARHPGP